jgi:GNAT superfamily N-acetyltransferase
MDTEQTSYSLPLLTEELLESITFSMEDQETRFYLDLQKGSLINEKERRYFLEDEEDLSEDRFLSIPDWEPSDGFHLMEQFANRVRNPLYRTRLLGALQSGKGVFRKFKDTLAELPILERKWFAFKEEQLRRVVITWYREQEGVLGLMKLPAECEELTEDILLEDFTFESYEGEAPEDLSHFMQELLEQGRSSDEEDAIASFLIARRLELLPPTHFQIARTQEGALAAFLAYELLGDGVVEVPFFAVKRDYRGLGLFRLLFDSFSRQMARLHYMRILITLSGDAVTMDRFFTPYGAEPICRQLVVKSDEWNAANRSSEEAFL